MKKFPLLRTRGRKTNGIYGDNTPIDYIPWEVAEKAYTNYSRKYGTSQSIEAISKRGGFCQYEMDDFYPSWREEVGLPPLKK